MTAERAPELAVPLYGRIAPAQLRQALERLGPTFVKLGQHLALRPDVIDQAYCDELLRLVDQVPQEPFARVRAIIAEDLGASPEELVAWMARQPIGSGSLAQVYHARLHDGTELAVKVQRSDARARTRRDLARGRWLARLLGGAGLAPGISAAAVIEQLARWMEEELDLELELRNVGRIWRAARTSRALVVPRPYPALSGRRVVTTEFLGGVPFSVILRAVRAGRPQEIEALGFDLAVLPERLIEAALEQMFRYRLFQADMHPGNIIALPGNRIGFIDFGLVETLDPTLEAGLFRYVRAVYSNDVEELLHGLNEILVPGERGDPDGFRRDFLEENRRLRRERARPGGAGSPIGRYMIGVLRAARRHDMGLPQGILAIYRSLLSAEMVAHQLGGAADLATAGQRFFAQLQLESLLRLRAPQEVAGEVIATLETARELPRRLDRLLGDLAGDRFRLRVEQVASAADRRLRGDQTRLVTAAVTWVGLAVLLAAGERLPLPAGWPVAEVLWAALAANALWLAALWRRLP